MTKLNWRDASKTLPLKGCVCLVILKNNGSRKDPFQFDFFITNLNGWAVNDEVTHWIYADEIPLPEE